MKACRRGFIDLPIVSPTNLQTSVNVLNLPEKSTLAKYFQKVIFISANMNENHKGSNWKPTMLCEKFVCQEKSSKTQGKKVWRWKQYCMEINNPLKLLHALSLSL